MQSKSALPPNLKAYRKIHKYSQEHCAELCDISPRYWGKLERGQADPSMTVLFKLSDGLGLSIAQLLDNEFFQIEEDNTAQVR